MWISKTSTYAAKALTRNANTQSKPLALRLQSTTPRPPHRRHKDKLVPAAEPSFSPTSDVKGAMSFPCVDRLEQRTRIIAENGPEPAYGRATGYKTWSPSENLSLDFGGQLRQYTLAYETWGTLNSDHSNAILLHTGLSANSHAKSHSENPAPGWWEKFIGPGLSIDTDKFFVVCTNVLGGCAGSTGPSSMHPEDGAAYATRFPMLSIHDMVRAQHALLTKELKISKLFASVGSSMGGMQSLALATDFPSFTTRVASISSCARSHPSSIAMRFVQRQILMSDPNWRRGFYYGHVPPHVGMKLARQIATISYRSGPEWEERFGRDRMDPSQPPALCPDFLIETYLDHQGEKFWESYDANSLLYISKAMDLFDLGAINAKSRTISRAQDQQYAECSVPEKPYSQRPRDHIQPVLANDLVDGMQSMKGIPTLVLGVESDLLFPVWQQREVARVLESVNGGPSDLVQYIELDHRQSKFGHDTFLLDLEHIGVPLKRWLESF